MADPWGDDPFCLTPPTPPAAPEPAAAPPVQLRIDGTWLVEEVQHHTCGAGPGSYGGMHEPGCGLVPVVDLSTLPGYAELTGRPEPAPAAAHQGELAGSDCPVCGPLLATAQETRERWTTAQLGGRGTEPYREARRAARVASEALLAAKQAHYGARRG